MIMGTEFITALGAEGKRTFCFRRMNTIYFNEFA